MPLCNNPTPLEVFKEHSEIVVDFNNDSTSSDDDSPYGEDIDYVDASPPDAEIVSLEVVEIVIPKIEALKDNPIPSSEFVTKSSSTSLNFFLEETNTFDNSLPESKTFCFNLEEISSGGSTTLSDYSLSNYEAFYLDDDHVEEKSSGSTTTHADFSQYDSFIFIFLSRDAFSISFIHDHLFDTLLPFSSKNEDKVVNTGILAVGEENLLSSLMLYGSFLLFSRIPFLILLSSLHQE
ncbi:hypothetical protein Tco_1108708 [Tanacetum coccineum]